MISQLQPLTAKRCEFWFFDMVAKKDQRSAIKFCDLLGKTATETGELIKGPYNDSTIKSRTFRKWHKHFKEGPEQACDEGRMGWPRNAKTEQNIEKVRGITDIDRRVTLHRNLILDNL